MAPPPARRSSTGSRAASMTSSQKRVAKSAKYIQQLTKVIQRVMREEHVTEVVAADMYPIFQAERGNEQPSELTSTINQWIQQVRLGINLRRQLGATLVYVPWQKGQGQPAKFRVETDQAS